VRGDLSVPGLAALRACLPSALFSHAAMKVPLICGSSDTRRQRLGMIDSGSRPYADGRWVADPSATRDPDIRKAGDFDQLVRNVYKVLLTRGLRGCVIYSVDPETQQMLARLGIPSLQDSSGA
jgi:hypothetical protein